MPQMPSLSSLRNLPRRVWIYIGIAVIAVVAVVVSETMFGRPDEDCRPVRELLEFNTAQSKLIDSKMGDTTGIPSVADETAYQKWADGLSQRAQNVNAPDLAQSALELASLANQFVAKMSRVRSEAQNQAPGAPAPPVAYEMSVLNIRITEHLGFLSKECPA
jgi:hypothetical protein